MSAFCGRRSSVKAEAAAEPVSEPWALHRPSIDPSPTLAVSAAVIHDERLLLAKRRREPAAGCWSLPGGRVRDGEPLREALLREVREETAARVRVGELIGVAEEIGDAGHFVVLGYRADLVGEPSQTAPGDDVSDTAWVPLCEVLDLRLAGSLAEFLVRHRVVPEPR